MPKMKGNQPKQDELPATLQRSGKKAQRTYAKAHDSAVKSYGEGRRAHQTAMSALKHTHEKVGDHWEPKEDGARGPSDPQAEGGADTDRETAEGVDANASKEHLLKIARRLDVKGRSTMTKRELVDAVKKANRRASRSSR